MRGHSPKVSRRGTSSNQLGPYERASTLFEDTEDYTRLFKEMFLVAAGDLANELQEPLENIGILFEDIMSTGTVRKRKRRLCSRFPEMDVLDRVERGPSTDLFCRGQLLFLVRRASRQESIKIQSTGYRFADVSNVIDFLAGSMEVTQRELLPCFKRMEAQAGKSNMLEPGAHLALFALRAMPKRLEVLVRSDAKNLLHATRLRLPRFVPQDEKWHQNILDTLDNMNSVECKAKLIALMSCGESDEKYHVLQELHAGVHRLFEGVPDELRSDARLMARPFRAPCCSTPANLNPERAYVIAFQVIVDIHKIIVPGPNKEFVSTKLFLCQQRSYRDATDNDTFVRRVRKEFAGLLEVIELPQTSSVSPSSRQQTAPSTLSRSRAASSEDVVSSGESSTKNLEPDRSSQSYGGIHVSKEVSIDISDNPLGEDSSGIEMTIVGRHKLRVPVGHTMGNRIQAGVKVTDGDHETWMDRLLALTIDGRNRPEALSR